MLKSLSRKAFIIVLLFVALFFTACLGFNIQIHKADAEHEDVNQICKYFTDSDSLVDSEGKLLETDILNFATELEEIKVNFIVEVHELAQVIPAQFLQREETDKEYHYFGQEYGFMVIHEGNILHVMIVDFDWESESTNQLRLKVKIIVSASFQIKTVGNKTTWIYCGHDNDMKFCLTNFKYSNSILNENDLNLGDDGYIKQNDHGVFLQQTRIAFNGFQIVDRDWQELVFFTVKTIEGFLPEVGTYFQLAYLPYDIDQQIQSFKDNTETVSANQENYIFTEFSREAQLQNEGLATFVKTKYLESVEEVYFGLGDFIEFNSLLSDTNQRSHIIQSLQFDVAT